MGISLGHLKEITNKMRFSLKALTTAIGLSGTLAFTSNVIGSTQTAFAPRTISKAPQHMPTSLYMGFDASLFSSVLLSDDVAAVAEEAAKSDNGWFGFLTLPIEGLLQILHTVLVGVGLSSNAWGVSIILLTIIIKLATYPLTKSQLESTNKMQASILAHLILKTNDLNLIAQFCLVFSASTTQNQRDSSQVSKQSSGHERESGGCISGGRSKSPCRMPSCSCSATCVYWFISCDFRTC